MEKKSVQPPDYFSGLLTISLANLLVILCLLGRCRKREGYLVLCAGIVWSESKGNLRVLHRLRRAVPLMLFRAHLLPNLPHEIRFHRADARIWLFDETGEQMLLLAGPKHDDRTIIFNDQLSGTWGKEMTVSQPGPGEFGHGILWIKFNGSHLEAWTHSFATVFDRFDASRAGSVRFMKTRHAQNPGKSLELRVLSPEAMTFELNYHLLHGRLNQLEKAMRAQLSQVSAAE